MLLYIWHHRFISPASLWPHNVLYYDVITSLGDRNFSSRTTIIGSLSLTKNVIRTKKLKKRELPSACLEVGHWYFPAFWLKMKHLIVLRPLDCIWHYISPLLGLQLVNYRTWNFSASIIIWDNSIWLFKCPPIYLPIYPPQLAYWFCFSGES